jgi:hypothetical protein
MMPQINISHALMDKLKSVAEPFIDTPETVIARCVDFYISKHSSGSYSKTESGGPDSPALYAAEAAPDLTFTRLIAVTLDGVKYQKKDLYWNALLFDVVAKAAAKLKSPDKLRQAILVNYVEGQGPQDKGYRHIAEAKLSVQGQDSNAAWKATMHLVKAAQLTIEVVFIWENKEKAARPGQTGRMTYQSV